MADYKRKPQIFVKRGMNVTMPGDRLAQEWFQYVQNVRSYKVGEWRQRPGMPRLYPSLGESIYYISRINNNVDGTFRRLVATNAGKVYTDNSLHTTLSVADTGYSTTDFSSVIARPDRSPLPFLFLANGSKMSKFSSTGLRFGWGLAAPIPPISPATDNQVYTLLMDPIPGSADYTAGNGTLALPGRISAVNPTFIIPDSTFAGMASIVLPASVSTTDLQPGMVMTVQHSGSISPDYAVVVDDTFQPIEDTTISGIVYDSGTTGLCTIQLATATTGLRKDSAVQIDSEGVRVLSVTDGLDGVPSFRCSTTVNHTVGAVVLGLRSFRAFFPVAPLLTDSFFANYVRTTVTNPGISTITKNFGGLTPVNMASAQGRPLQPEDIVHLSLRVQDWSQVTEIQIQFDCDQTLNDFLRNYFFKSVRPPDFQGNISQTVTATSSQQTGITRTQVDEFARQKIEEDQFFELPDVQLGDSSRRTADKLTRDLGSGFEISSDQGPLSGQSTSGNLQCTELFIPISEFQRVGSDMTRGWADIMKFRVSIIALSSIVIDIGALWIGGTYGPNTIDLPGYTYICRARDTNTGTRSNPSPPTRSPIYPKRDAVFIPAPSAYPDGANVFDFYRIGGTLGNYHYVGSTGIGGLFKDTIPDSLARRNPMVEMDRFKPWPRADLPKTGNCNVVGTSVTWTSGDTFNTAWVRGTQIIIADRVYSLYTNPSSTTKLELNESGGLQTGVPFQIPDPVLDSQPMPIVFGPFVGASGEFLFGCGDPINPGYLYWTNGNDPESASDVNNIELCNPSEKLMNGVVLDGITFCFSDKRSWRILPSFQGGQSEGGSNFYPQETSMGKGLAGRFGLCVGDSIYFVSFDGIYRSRGDAVEDLTAESLAPLFDRDGTFVTDFTVPVSPINFSVPDDISLTYSFDGLYFTYRGRDTNLYTFFMSSLTGGWVLDSIATGSILRSYREVRTQDADNVIVGTTDGRLMIRSNSAFLDDTDAISCRIWDREEIWDDLRSTKQVGDVMIDINPAGATITPTTRYENNTSNDALSVITGSVRDQYVRDINGGSGRIVRGTALDLTWSNGSSGVPRVYAWEPAALVKSEESSDRATDWDNGGYTGTKWLQGFRLRGDTSGVVKSFQVEIDGSPAAVEGFTFTANGEQTQAFSLTTPVVAHEFRIRGTDGDLWRNMGIEWIFEPEPEQATVWETQVTSLDLPFYSHIREVMIAHRSTSDITMTITTDGVSNSYVIPNGGGSRIRSYLPVRAIKAKEHSFRFTSLNPFGLWINDIECKAGPWGRADSYTVQKPFGDISRSNGGAKI